MPWARPWRALADGVELRLRVTPGARRTSIDGIETRAGQPVLRLRVTAPADKGRANEAVIALLAKSLRTPKSAVAITAGQSARDKRVRVLGDPATLTARLAGFAG